MGHNSQKIKDAQAKRAENIENTIDAEQARVDDEKAAKPELDLANDVGGVSGQRLKAFIERVERLEEEKAALAEDIKDVFAECKGVGFDTKIVRKVIRLRKMDKEKRQEEEAILELYKSAIGMD